MQPGTVAARSGPDLPGADPLPRRHLVFGIVSLAMLMSSIDMTIVATALGTLQRDLHTQINWSTWTITVYALGRIVVLPIAGRISDQYGRKRVFLIAIAIFTTASLCCGLANDIYVLIVLRAVQAIGGGAFQPSATGIVADHYGRERDRAIGMFTSIIAVGGIVGPILGGVFVHYWSWRWIFFVNVPLGVLLFVLTLAFVPNTRRAVTQRFDLAGMGLLAVGLLALMLAVSTLGSAGTSVTNPVVIVGLCIAAATIPVFVRRSARVPHAIIPRRLLTGRGFGVMNTINFMWGSSMLGFGALVPLYAEQRYGVPVLGAGTLLTARAIGMAAVTSLATLALGRTGYRRPILFGFVVGAIGLAMMSISPHGGLSAYSWLAIAAGITGVGMGAAVPASNVATLHMAEESLASVSGLRAMFRQCGGITGIAVVSAIVARGSGDGMTFGYASLVFGLILCCLTPLVLHIPEKHGYGSAQGPGGVRLSTAARNAEASDPAS